MRLIKEKIKFRGNDIKIPLKLTSNDNFNGQQQSINDFVEEKTDLSINPVVDVDTFKYKTTTDLNYNFYFFSGVSWSSTYKYAGFTTGETSTRSEGISRSFFLIQVYDTNKSESQTLLHSGFFNGFQFLADELEGNSITAQYTLTTETEFTDFYIPNSFIEELSGVTTTIYCKLLFYNAKTGKIQLFYPSSISDPPVNESHMYLECQLNPLDKTYTITFPLYFKELPNSDYRNNVNNTLSSFANKKPNYPDGSTFQNDGSYI